MKWSFSRPGSRAGLLALALGFALVLLGLGCRVWASPLEPFEKGVVSEGELTQLRQGRVVVKEPPKQQADRYVVARVLIDRPMDRVWNLIENQEAMFAGDPHFPKVKTLQKPAPGKQLVEYKLALSKLLPAFNYVTTVDLNRTSRLARFNRVSGTIKDFKGFCKLSPVEGGKTVLTYGLSVDPGFMVPPFVVNQVLKSELPTMLNNIEQRVYKQYPNP